MIEVLQLILAVFLGAWILALIGLMFLGPVLVAIWAIATCDDEEREGDE